MKSIVALILLLLLWVPFVYGKPMESVDCYHVIRVHGAADSESGMD